MTNRGDGYVALSESTEAVHESEHTPIRRDSGTDSQEQPLLPPSPSSGSKHGFTKHTSHLGSFTVSADGHTYSYTYGPKGLAGLVHNYYALLCAVFASIGGLTFGYDQGVIANVLIMSDFLQRWPLTALQKGLLTAVLELGALFGALSAGILADRFSRRYSICLACIIFCIGSGFQCGAQSLTHLFVGRAIGGVGVGALSMLSPLYMAEISPPEVRGSLMSLEQFSIVLGVVFGFWTGFFTRSIHSSASWRIPLGIQIIPGVILGIGCIFLPPSPRHLVLQGRYEEALRSLARLRLRAPDEADSDPLLQIEMLEMRVETTLIQRSAGADSTKNGFGSELKAWGKLFRYKYRDRTMIGVLMMVFQQWSGINAFLYFGPILVQSIGMRGDKVILLVSGGIGVVQLLAVFPAILYIDRLGRRLLLRSGGAVMAASHLVIAMIIRLSGSGPSSASGAVAVWGSIACMYIFTAAYGVSFGPVAWILPSEVFPLSIRSKGVALSTASNWMNNFLIGLVTPSLMDISPAGTFMVFSTACFLAYFWATYFVPETANASLEEIDGMFRSSAGREDVLLKQQIEEDLGLTELIRELESTSD